MKTLRVGIAGMGFGGDVHLPGWLSLPGIDVVGVSSRHIERARSFADKHGVKNAFDSWESLLESGLDIVSFALPPVENERACECALTKGIPVLSEKPLAASAGVAERLAEMAAGRPTAVDFEFSELEAFRRLKALLDTKTCGDCRHVQVTWLIESYSQRAKQWSWKTDRAQGGGVTAVLGCHLFYLLEWLLGEMTHLDARVSSAATARFTPAGSEPADDLVEIRTTHASGVTVSATYGNAAPSGPGHRWICVCDAGTITLDNPTTDYMSGFGLSVSAAGERNNVFQDSGTPGVDGRLAPFRSLAQRFATAVRGGAVMSPDFVAGARVQRFMDEVLTSARCSA